MKIHLHNTMGGLVPLFDPDGDQKRKLKLGQTYIAEIKLMRNLEFHRKYFKLIALSWEYQNEARQFHFKTIENFRKYIEVAAGHSELFYSPKLQEWVEIPKSISFEKMDNAEFEDLYNKVKYVLFATFLKHISEEEFMKNLSNF